MSLPRFYAAPLAATGELTIDQAHHARDVLRLPDGQMVVLFDGRGHWANSILTVEKKHVGYVITGVINHDPKPVCPLTIAAAMPKGDRANYLLEQISQLGVANLIWLDCRYSVAHPSDDRAKMDKWRRLAVESAKQCGRSRVLSIEPPLTPRQLLAHHEYNAAIIWTHVGVSETLRDRLTAIANGPAGTPTTTSHPGVTILIGPEGGWSDEEIALFSASSPGVRLGNHILRIETAAVTAAAIAQAAFRNQ